MMVDVLQADSAHWVHLFQYVAGAVSDEYRAEWYEADLRKTLERLKLGPVRYVRASSAGTQSLVVAGACVLGTTASAALEGVLAAFDSAAGLFERLDHSASLSEIDMLVTQLGRAPTSRAIAERVYDHQLALYVGLLTNWPKYEEERLRYEINRELDRIECKLRALRQSFPDFADKPLPNPFRRP